MDQDLPGRGDGRLCRVLGVGNILLADEGFGPAVVAWLLDRFEFDPAVEVLDCATMGLALLPYFESAGHVVVVDVVDGTGLAPGTVVRFTPDDIAPRTQPPSAHDTGVCDIVAAARLRGFDPQVACVGAQAGLIRPERFTMSLTPAVSRAVEPAARQVLALLDHMGAGLYREKDGGNP